MKKLASIALLVLLLLIRNMAAYVYINNTRAASALTNGTSWAQSYMSISNANSSAAGDTNLVAFCHSEQTGSGVPLLINPPGTFANPSYYICCDTNSSPGTIATNTAVCSTSGTAAITFGTGFATFDGFIFAAGNGAGASTIAWNANFAAWGYSFKNTSFYITNTAVAARITVGVSGATRDQALRWENVFVKFGNASQAITAAAGKDFWWNTSTNSAILGTVIPTTLFANVGAGTFPQWEIRGVNLSAITNNLSILSMGAAAGAGGKFKLYNCKLGAAAGMTTGSTAGPGSPDLWLYNCDSADTNYRFYHFSPMGEEFSESTIVKTGGATDGTTPFSRRLATSANASIAFPLDSDWFYGWTDTTGSAVTLGVNIVTDSYTNYNNDVWLEVESQDTSGFPLSVFYNNSFTNVLQTAGIQPIDNGPTWTTTGLTSPIKQTLSATITPQQKGFFRGRLRMARPSKTIYYDPLFTNAFNRAYMTGSDGIIDQLPSSSGTTIIGGGSTFSQ